MALFGLIALSVLFVAAYILMSLGSIRGRLVDRLGAWGFRVVYALVFILTLGGAILIYAFYRSLGPQLWGEHWYFYPLIYLLVLFGFLLLFYSLPTPSPVGMFSKTMEARGVLRVTRHPVNMGLASFALGHVLANGYLGDVFFWGALFIAAFVGAYLQDWRRAKELGEEFAGFKEKTSILPFAAIIRGRNTFETHEFSILIVILTLVVFGILFYMHRGLFEATPY